MIFLGVSHILAFYQTPYIKLDLRGIKISASRAFSVFVAFVSLPPATADPRKVSPLFYLDKRNNAKLSSFRMYSFCFGLTMAAAGRGGREVLTMHG